MNDVQQVNAARVPAIASDLDVLSVNAIRFLAADAVEHARSGHPGLPMGAAPMAYVLWQRFLKHNPADPKWPDRDRFVLSAGHGVMLLYALLHLTGYDLSLSSLKSFRQWGSRTPGHPENHVTPGVEATTGPLGQGISKAVGMAIAEAHLAARFNRPGHEIVDHHTYVLASDGDLMEGVAAEACSLAGHLKLGKLIVLYDDNRVSLAGSTALAFSEDVRARFRAYGWHAQRVEDGTDLEALDGALHAARATKDRPSIILVRTEIGHGAPSKAGTFEAHGSPAKQNLGWPVEPPFWVPSDVLDGFRWARIAGRTSQMSWEKSFASYAEAFPDLAAEFTRVTSGELPDRWSEELPTFSADEKGLPTRKASEAVLQVLARDLPELLGGSADLNPSNLHFGVREHAMGAAVNGLALHGGVIPYGSTFLVFSDYMRPAIRLSALAKLRAIWVFTHDSIALGEDGPTHQPIEHFSALRAIPGLLFIRPGDANETAWAWRVAIENRRRPTALALTRQNVPTLDRGRFASAQGLTHGAYILNPNEERGAAPDVILIATGSELRLIVAAERILAAKGVTARLVSMPCWELFAEQPKAYRDHVLPPTLPRRLAVEAGVSQGWEKWIGDQGATITLDRFGASAPAQRLLEEFGFTAEHVATRALELVG
jgi:transketolase